MRWRESKNGYQKPFLEYVDDEGLPTIQVSGSPGPGEPVGTYGVQVWIWQVFVYDRSRGQWVIHTLPMLEYTNDEIKAWALAVWRMS